jgi:8-oxo-dGTP pyrophosphatase MutT (NUDIX family)
MKLLTAGLLVIQNEKLLMAFSRNKACFYLPGGKVDTGETTAAALCREITEELQVELSPTDLQYYTHITAPAFGEAAAVIMEQDCFFCLRAIQPNPAAEIGELRYFTLGEYLKQPQQAPGAVRILEMLTEEGYLAV